MFYLQNIHMAYTYQIFFPKIKWKHITLFIYHLFDEKTLNPKVFFIILQLVFNVNLLKTNNLT
jgi:hypothetical protein